VKRLADNKTILAYESIEIDMWRGTEKEHFVRPKWGFYRSLKSKYMLGSEQDIVRFADFKVIKY
jgi:outer membrane translocation and assembly module TamA